MQYKELGKTGLRVSIIGFGASPLGNEFGTITAADCERAVRTAIDDGINFFDVSPYYGRTVAEARLGQALAGHREKVVLSTKCGRYDAFDFSATRVARSIDESLTRLRTDYVDLLLAHDIEFGGREQIIHETLPAMRILQKEGKVRSIGVSGLPLKMLADVAQRADIDVVLSYCHFNLLARDLDEYLTPVVQARGIGLINASPLHMRLLSTSGPPPWHPAPDIVRWKGAAAVALMERLGLNPIEVALRFCLNHPYVSSTLVGMSNANEVKENIKALDFKLPADLMDELDHVTAPVHSVTWPSGRPENNDV
ncbi:MAG TPA: aldo/keto reductase [Bryobacteraceae bacterium]|nr:aldo/keto reductase [Bryobacteraceae bacterium]